MVAAVQYLAAAEDHAAMLDYLGEPGEVSLHPWPIVRSTLERYTREQALSARQVMVVHRDRGPARIIRPGDTAMVQSTKAGLFNRLNWERLSPRGEDGLVDSNTSPVIFWQPGQAPDGALHGNSLGSQADSMSAISADYERWVNRTMAWIKRRGTKVWGLERGETRPDLDIRFPHVTSVYAMPGALAAMEEGVPAR